MKKAFGIIFLIIGSFFGLSIITSIPRLLSTAISLLSRTSTSYEWGQATGEIFAFLSIAAITFFLFRFGLKWVKK
jgi:Ca2+/Na+ antiporter